MTLDPETRQAVIEHTAQVLAAQIRAELGTLDQLILIDTRTAAQCLGVTRAYVQKKFPTFALTDRTVGIRLSDLKAATTPR